jgi:hypothetical protein
MSQLKMEEVPVYNHTHMEVLIYDIKSASCNVSNKYPILKAICTDHFFPNCISLLLIIYSLAPIF